MNNFFVEMFNRIFKSKSPAFFARMQIVVGCLSLASYIPEVLSRWFGVSLPETTVTMCNDIGKYFTGAFAMLFLPAKSKEPEVKKESFGRSPVVPKVDEKLFPFTAKKEKEEKAEETTPTK